MKKRLFTVCSFIVVLLANLAPALAQTDKASSGVAGIANYQGADRGQRLVAGAKKERQLLLYTNIAATDVEKITADFAKRYGVKLNVWRAGPDKVLQSGLTEA